MASSAAFESDREMALRMQQAIEEEDRLMEQQQAIAAGAVARAGARAARAGGVRLAQNNQHCTAEDAAFKADLKAAMVASKQATLGGDSGRATSRQWGGRKGRPHGDGAQPTTRCVLKPIGLRPDASRNSARHDFAVF